MESVVTRGRKRDNANLFRLFAAFLAVGGLFWFSFCWWGWLWHVLEPSCCNSVQDLLRLAIIRFVPYVVSFVFSFGFVYAIGRPPKKGHIYIAGALCTFLALLEIVLVLDTLCSLGRVGPAFLFFSFAKNSLFYRCLTYICELFAGYMVSMNLFLFITGALTSKNSKQLATLAILVLLGNYTRSILRRLILCLPLWIPPFCLLWLWGALCAILTIVAVAIVTRSSKDIA